LLLKQITKNKEILTKEIFIEYCLKKKKTKLGAFGIVYLTLLLLLLLFSFSLAKGWFLGCQLLEVTTKQKQIRVDNLQIVITKSITF